MLDLIFTYYHYYFYMFCAFAGTGLVCFLYKRFEKKEDSVFLSSVKQFIYIIGDMLIALILKHHFDQLVLCTVAFVAGALLVFIVRALYVLVLIIKSHVNDKSVIGISTFIYLFINQLIHPRYELLGWPSVWYAVNYSMGIGSRFLIGSILSLICGDYIPTKIVVDYCNVVNFSIIVLISILITILYMKCKENCRVGFIYIWIMFLVCPSSVVSLWQKGSFGRLEVHCLLLCLICLLVYMKHGLNAIISVIITVFSCVTMAIYQGNIFMYYALVLMIYIWEFFKSSNRLKTGIYAFSNLLFTSISFIYFQFFSYTTFDDATQMVNTIAQRTDLAISEDAVNYECFQTITVAFKEVNIKFFTENLLRERFFLAILLMAPIIIMFIGLYKKLFSSFKKKNVSIFKSVHLYFVALLLVILPQFVLNVDWGRWLISETFILFFGFLFLIWKEDEYAVSSLSALTNWIIRHKWISLLALLLVAGLDRMEHVTFIDKQVGMIVRWLVVNNWFVIG